MTGGFEWAMEDVEERESVRYSNQKTTGILYHNTFI